MRTSSPSSSPSCSADGTTEFAFILFHPLAFLFLFPGRTPAAAKQRASSFCGWESERERDGAGRGEAPLSSAHVGRIRKRLRIRPFLPPAGEGGIRQSRMTEEGERDRQQTVKTFAHSPRLRSFSHCGPVTFSLSGRPCGRHPPPLGEGRGESALDNRHVRRIRSIYMQGTAFSTSPAAYGNDLVPPLANPHTSGRGRRPRRPPQQHITEATRQANSQIGTCRARRPRRAAQQPRGQAATSGESAAVPL